jgi:hypothetical protein
MATERSRERGRFARRLHGGQKFDAFALVINSKDNTSRCRAVASWEI